ncbi:MAG: c-type cytochrome [Burkholderiaceae bacterium]
MLFALAVGLLAGLTPRTVDARGTDPPPPLLPHGGSPEAGREAIRAFGCGACHRIPGVADARGNVGPDLAGFARRSYIAGRLPNTPGNLEAWLRDPPAIDPATAMPAMGMDAGQIRDITSFLYRLD